MTTINYIELQNEFNTGVMFHAFSTTVGCRLPIFKKLLELLEKVSCLFCSVYLVSVLNLLLVCWFQIKVALLPR